MLNPLAALIPKLVPILPAPIMPTVRPVMSYPSIYFGAHANVPVLTMLSPSMTRRAQANINVNAVSAVASVSTSGVFVT